MGSLLDFAGPRSRCPGLSKAGANCAHLWNALNSGRELAELTRWKFDPRSGMCTFLNRMCTFFGPASKSEAGRDATNQSRPTGAGRARRRGARGRRPCRNSRALIEGRLTPGAKLPEHRLAKIFGVSRERVRKVLHRLVAERRLEAIPQRGVFVPNPARQEICPVYLAHRVFEAGVLAELARAGKTSIFDQLDAHLAEERGLRNASDRPPRSGFPASSTRCSSMRSAIPNCRVSCAKLLARSSLMVSAFEPARLSLCGVDEHAAIAAAMRAGDVERRSGLSGEHFRHIEERLAQGFVERAEREIEEALAPCARANGPESRANAAAGQADRARRPILADAGAALMIASAPLSRRQ